MAIAVAYAVPLLVLPPTPPIPLIEDRNHLISVRRLVEDGELWVAPWTAATLVLQIGWGLLLARFFGVGPEAARASTLVASLGGTFACFGLSYRFTTDVPFLALLSATGLAMVRATRQGPLRWLAVGSTVAGLAFLVRQQGVLLPLATVVWLFLGRPTWLRSSPWSATRAVVGPRLAAAALFLL